MRTLQWMGIQTGTSQESKYLAAARKWMPEILWFSPLIPLLLLVLALVVFIDAYPLLDPYTLVPFAIVASGVLALLMFCVVIRISGFSSGLVGIVLLNWLIVAALLWIVGRGLNGYFDTSPGHAIQGTVLDYQISPGYRGTKHIEVDITLRDGGVLIVSLGDATPRLRDLLRGVHPGTPVVLQIRDGWLHAPWIDAP